MLRRGSKGSLNVDRKIEENKMMTTDHMKEIIGKNQII